MRSLFPSGSAGSIHVLVLVLKIDIMSVFEDQDLWALFGMSLDETVSPDGPDLTTEPAIQVAVTFKSAAPACDNGLMTRLSAKKFHKSSTAPGIPFG